MTKQVEDIIKIVETKLTEYSSRSLLDSSDVVDSLLDIRALALQLLEFATPTSPITASEELATKWATVGT